MPNPLNYFTDPAIGHTGFAHLVMPLLLAFLAGQFMAWIYIRTHSGLSYSRTFVHSLVLIPVTVCLVMSVLDNNLVTAFSLMGIFAIVRFRNVIRDTLDTVFMLTLIVIGMAAGTQRYAIAVTGTLLFAALQLYLSFTHFGNRQRFDFMINFQWTPDQAPAETLEPLLQRHALRIHLARQRFISPDTGMEFSYRVYLRDPHGSTRMMRELASLPGVSHLTGLTLGDENEV